MNEVDSVSCCVWTQIGTVTNVKQQNGNAMTDQKSGVCFIITDKRRTSSIINHGFLTLLNTFLSSLCTLATVLLLVTVFGLGLISMHLYIIIISMEYWGWGGVGRTIMEIVWYTVCSHDCLKLIALKGGQFCHLHKQ